MSASMQARAQAVSAEYQKLQSALAIAIDARQKLEAQQTENQQVKKEFEGLKPNESVYKLIGPVLMPVEQSEAKSNVGKRLDFIGSEIKRMEAQIKDINEKADEKKDELVQLQAEHTQQQQQALEQGATA